MKYSDMTLYQIIKHKISRLVFKYQRWIRKRPMDEVDRETQEFQNSLFHICRKLLNQKDSELIYTPISEKRIIKNDRLGIYLTLQGRHAFVTNHVYNYSIILHMRMWDRVLFLFNHEMERRRKSYEVVINTRISHSLNDILGKF